LAEFLQDAPQIRLHRRRSVYLTFCAEHDSVLDVQQFASEVNSYVFQIVKL
jgi:hypothetical protein